MFIKINKSIVKKANVKSMDLASKQDMLERHNSYAELLIIKVEFEDGQRAIEETFTKADECLKRFDEYLEILNS